MDLDQRLVLLQHISEYPDVKIVESDDGCRVVLDHVKKGTLRKIIEFVGSV